MRGPRGEAGALPSGAGRSSLGDPLRFLDEHVGNAVRDRVGQTAPVAIPLDPRLPAGPWHARLTLTSGTVTRAAEATLLFPTLAGTSAPAVPAKPIPITKRRSVVVPAAGGLLGLLALAFLLLLLLRRRKKRDDDADPPTQPEGKVLAASRPT